MLRRCVIAESHFELIIEDFDDHVRTALWDHAMLGQGFMTLIVDSDHANRPEIGFRHSIGMEEQLA